MKEYIIKVDDQKKDITGGMPLVGEAQELVRCKDCRCGGLWLEENVIVCDILSKTRNKNWFCADGERRTDDA